MPGADVLQQELRGAVLVAGHREGTRKERTLVAPSPPALGGCEHRELAGRRRGAARIGDGDDAVDAQLADVGDLRKTASERRLCRRRERAHATPAPPAAAGAASSEDSPGVFRATCDPASAHRRAGIARPGALRARRAWRRAADAVQVLQAHHLGLAVDEAPGDRAGRRHPRRERRQARHAVGHRGTADLVPVGAGTDPRRGVDHEVDVAAFDPVHDVRGALADLVQPLDRHAHASDRLRGAAGRDDPEARVVQRLRDPHPAGLVFVGDGDEDRALDRKRHAGCGLCLGERRREVACDTHHLAGRTHLRAEHGVGVLEAVEGQYRLLDRDVIAVAEALALLREVHPAEALAEHHPAGELRQRHPDGLRDERDGP